MTIMPVGRYVAILTLQTFLLVVDFSINSFGIFLKEHNSIMLLLFIMQDVCLLIALAALLLSFFGTYVFQAGLVELLYDRFRLTIIICLFYFLLTTVIFLWMLILRWNGSKSEWNLAMLIVFVLHRLLAPIYYYFYKRAALRISDPRFYAEFDWEQSETAHAISNK